MVPWRRSSGLRRATICEMKVSEVISSENDRTATGRHCLLLVENTEL
jgi:hypothetical protein